ncbi:DUF2533 family protein [Tepidibacillus fermentans]|uniref:Uncharacterized protein DUF2533 n=1 Tax=Tepidibacillus fermentans TaxID=1281767 RepID=A0A4R3KJD7_9BACI|nr:DUF2533 family protein [Tepidibacillus fermentans]TCS83778.1 uncharacterized protein DUF2533 [Tepidibacillus fermentans]
MASVHLEISKKVNEKVKAIETYKKMDQQREAIIDKLVADYQAGKPIDLAPLNQWTQKMNEFAVKNQLPTRKIVTIEMFESFMN